MLRYAKAKVSRLGKVALLELVLFDFQATLENLLGLGTADGDMNGNLFVSTNAKSSNGIPCFAYKRWSEGTGREGRGLTVDWRLATELLKHFGSSSQSITRFANGNVENEFLDTKLSHGIARLVL